MRFAASDSAESVAVVATYALRLSVSFARFSRSRPAICTFALVQSAVETDRIKTVSNQVVALGAAFGIMCRTSLTDGRDPILASTFFEEAIAIIQVIAFFARNALDFVVLRTFRAYSGPSILTLTFANETRRFV